MPARIDRSFRITIAIGSWQHAPRTCHARAVEPVAIVPFGHRSLTLVAGGPPRASAGFLRRCGAGGKYLPIKGSALVGSGPGFPCGASDHFAFTLATLIVAFPRIVGADDYAIDR